MPATQSVLEWRAALALAAVAACALAGCPRRQPAVPPPLGQDERDDDPDEHTGAPKNAYFGDLDVKTGDGLDGFVLHATTRGVTEACEFARACSGLDFFAVTDAAHDLSALAWRAQRDAMIECNRGALPKEGDKDALFAGFLGFEWTGTHDATGFGRKLVLFRNSTVPEKPIAAPVVQDPPGPLAWAAPRHAAAARAAGEALAQPLLRTRYADRLAQLAATRCAEHDLHPARGGACRTFARTPGDLFEALAALGTPRRTGERGYGVLAIAGAPAPGDLDAHPTRWDVAIDARDLAPAAQRLIVVHDDAGSHEPLVQRALLVARLGLVAGMGSQTARPGAAAEPWSLRLADGTTFDAPRPSGGLTGVHAEARTRRAIWRALERRETFATSGLRVVVEMEARVRGRTIPMGGEHVAGAGDAPLFVVRARGAPVPRGAPDPEAPCAPVCEGRCDPPGAGRAAIARIEIVRVLPGRGERRTAGDACAGGPRVDDPWRTFDGNATDTLEARFTDEEIAACSRRPPAAYYVRVIQAAPGAATAWSSPIWIDPGPADSIGGAP